MLYKHNMTLKEVLENGEQLKLTWIRLGPLASAWESHAIILPNLGFLKCIGIAFHSLKLVWKGRLLFFNVESLMEKLRWQLTLSYMSVYLLCIVEWSILWHFYSFYLKLFLFLRYLPDLGWCSWTLGWIAKTEAIIQRIKLKLIKNLFVWHLLGVASLIPWVK